MTCAISLTQGKLALVDDEDVALLSPYKWRVNSKSYTIRSYYLLDKEVVLCMHRIILNAPCGMYVDHTDNDTLNNCKTNLRLCTQSENLANRGRFRNSTTGFTGVTFHHGRWRSHMQIDERILFLGVYDGLLSAALVRDHAARLLFGEFARPNLPDQPIPDELRQQTEARLRTYGFPLPE